MDINKLMQEAQKMQAKMQKAQEEMANSDFEGSASNGLVKVTLNGEMEVKSVKIDPSVVDASEVEMLEDLVMIAFNEAVKKVNETSEANFGSLTKGLNFPGM